MPTRYSDKLKVTIIDFGPVHGTREEIAEEETRRDLQKPLEQLLWDIHCEAHDPDRTPEDNIIGTNKRFASLMLRVAKSSDRVSFWMIVLTVAITAMTAALLLFTYWMWQDTREAQARAENTAAAASVTAAATPAPVATPAPATPSPTQQATSPTTP